VGKVRVLNIFNTISYTTIPYELAQEINKDGDFDVVCLTFKNLLSDHKISNPWVYECVSRNRVKQVRFIWKHLARGRYDIVHTHHTYSSFVVHSLMKTVFKKRKIVCIHSMHNDFFYYSRMQKIMYATVIRCSDYVICNSRNTLSSIPKKYRCGKKKFFVAYNGVDTSAIRDIAQKRRHDRYEKYILSVGRLVPQKDHRSLIKAFKIVCEYYRDVGLIICGGGPLLKDLKELSCCLGVGDKVTFRGLIKREEVYALMANSTLFVTSSIFEGFCNANVEAMAAGACVVSTETGPMREVLGKAAILVAPRDHEQLADAMMSLLADEERRRGLSEEAVRRAEMFNITNAADKYKEIYMEGLSAIKAS
jgi:glycosyltransferase involved in cell wall biosynthesis